jgi:hypothetical protein
MTNKEKVKLALDIAFRHQTDAGHHAVWLVDQMVRALHGCPFEYKDDLILKDNNDYLKFVAQYEEGDYEWYTGIAP